MRFADPTNDLAFKKIFGNNKHKNILISFLNSVLDFKDQYEIADVFLNNHQYLHNIIELKEILLDLKVINKKQESFIVQIQKKEPYDAFLSSYFYNSESYTKKLPKENKYTKINKVYFIGILNFNIFENKNYISRHLIINQETSTQDLDDFEFSFIELPKFTKQLDQLNSILDKWIYFLKNASNLTVIPMQYETIMEFKEAFEIATQNMWNKKEMEVYDYITLKEFDELNALKTAEKKGIEKGIEKEKLNIAKNLLDILDDETIALKTGLKKELIKNLRK